MKKLGDDRLEEFDTDFVRNHIGWDRIEQMLRGKFAGGEFAFLDVGGGNGVFADRLLGMFPRARGTVLDNSAYLLNKNERHPRKTLLECSVAEVGERLGRERFDLITFNWVLHHLVEDSYRESLASIAGALRSGRRLLCEDGLVSIFENCYESWCGASLPSRVIFHALSSKSLARATRWLGANTAGTGVCYLSEDLWCAKLQDSGLQVLSRTRTSSLEMNAIKKLACAVKGVNVVHITAGRAP